jgi:hypothetical protein
MPNLSTYAHWADVVRPLFPPHAEVDVHTNAGQLIYRWPPSHVVSIFIAPNAVESYVGAQDDIRILADRNLFEFVRDNLARLEPGQAHEFRIVVASIDFVPLK